MSDAPEPVDAITPDNEPSAPETPENNSTNNVLLSHSVLKAVFDNAMNGIMLLSDAGIFLEANSEACKILGYPRAELLGMSHLELYPNENAKMLAMQNWNKFLREGVLRGMIWLQRKDGTELALNVHAVPSTTPHVHLMQFTDVTDRTRAEQALQDSEERLRFAMEAAAFGDWDMDIRTNKTRRSLRHDQIFGYDTLLPEWGYETFLSHIHPDDRAMVDENYRYAMAGNGKYDIVFRALWLDGTQHWLWSKGRFYFDEEGKAYRVAGIQADVTEREQAREALRNSLAFNTAVLNSLSVSLVVLDRDGVILAVNEEYRCFGRENGGSDDLSQILGTNYLAICEKGFGDNTSEEIKQSIEGIRAVLNGSLPMFVMEYPCHTKNRQRWFTMRVTPLNEARGGVVVAHEDITKERQLQEQLYESQKLESLGRLAGGVAHDFNNLLTAILGYTELSLTLLPDETKIRRFLTNVNTAAERATILTKQLLAYARRQMVEFSVVDITKIVIGLDPLLRRSIGEQYELVVVLNEDLSFVYANASQIDQVVMNLVINARDAMPEGGKILIETANVLLDAEYAEGHLDVIPGEYVLISISDTGVGMTPEVQERIFEPFFTTKGVGKGTGLGLSTCYGIVKQSMGHIRVYSELGRGTTFKVYLPRRHEGVPGEAIVPIEMPSGGTETILLTDDEPMVRDVAAHILRSQGYRVLEASNGPEALRIAEEYTGIIHLLVTDVVMPLMSGKELAQRLLEARPDLKILYVSGYTQNIILSQGILKPGFVLLTKPFSTLDLLRRTRQILDSD